MGAAESKVSPGTPLEERDEYKPPDNDFQLVFEAIKDLEHILMTQFESSGDNLHEMISTTNSKLPMDLIIDMRELATLRNNMAHEYNIDKVPNRDNFIKKYRKCVKQLNNEAKQKRDAEEKFVKDIIDEHRRLHPRPVIKKEEEKDDTIVKPTPFSFISCF